MHGNHGFERSVKPTREYDERTHTQVARKLSQREREEQRSEERSRKYAEPE